MDFESRLQGDGGRRVGCLEDLILGFFEKRGELVCAVCETGTRVSGENNELEAIN